MCATLLPLTTPLPHPLTREALGIIVIEVVVVLVGVVVVGVGKFSLVVGVMRGIYLY